MPRELLPRAVDERRRPRANRLAREKPPAVLRERLSRLVAPTGCLLQTLEADRLNILRTGVVVPARREGILVDDLPHDVEARRAYERREARHHLIEHRPERPHVGPRVRVPRFALRLFGRHVLGRPHHDARARELLVGLHLLREAKVHHHRPAIGRDDDVPGFQVAVDDPLLVRVVGRIGNILQNGDCAARRELAFCDELRERPTLDEVHREVVPALLHVELMDRDDVGVAQARGGGSLLEEAFHLLVGGSLAGDENFQRDDTVQLRVVRLVDDAHPAASELSEGPVTFGTREQRNAGLGRPVVGDFNGLRSGAGRRENLCRPEGLGAQLLAAVRAGDLARAHTRFKGLAAAWTGDAHGRAPGMEGS